MNATELMDFNQSHLEAVEFVITATEDYAACRCCLLNGLFSGFAVAAETVEKYLKAFLLFVDPSINVKKEYNHGIEKLANKAAELRPEFKVRQFNNVIDRLKQHYINRYPNDLKYELGATTAELLGIDEFVLYIYDSLPVPEAVKFRTYGYFFFASCPWVPAICPTKEWIERNNAALARVHDSLLQRYKAMEGELGTR